MKSFIALIISTLVTLGIGELGLRLLYPYGVNLDGSMGIWEWIEFNPIIGWQNQAGYQHDELDLAINAHNFRGPAISENPAAGVTRVVCIGDSRTFGVWLHAMKTRTNNAYPIYLQELIDDAGMRVEVINAGVIGYTSSQGLRQLVTRIINLQPDVIVASFGINDAAASWNPALRSAEPRSILAREALYAFAEFRILQLGMWAYHRLPGMFPEPMTVPWNDPSEYRRHMQRIAEVGKAAGARIMFLDQGLRNISFADRNPAMRAREQNALEILGFDNLADLHETYDVYQAIALEVANEEDIAVVHGAADFALYEGEPLFGKFDLVHVNKVGGQRLAQLVYDKMQGLGWLDTP